jgi:hypothetical protein
MEDSELTLQDLIGILKGYWILLLSKWKQIIIVVILCSSLGFYFNFRKKELYTSKLTFVVSEPSGGGGGMAAYSGIASQFGIDLGGSNSGVFSGENLIEFLKSQKMIESVLLHKAIINGKEQLVIDYYLEVYKYRKAWKKDSILSNLNFSNAEHQWQKDSVLMEVGAGILKRHLTVAKADKKLSIIIVNFKSLDQHLSKVFVETLVRNASEFYINTKTKKTRSNIRELERKADSLRSALDGAMVGGANAVDNNFMVVRQKASLSRARAEINIQLLSTLYGEVVKNLELTKFSLMNNEPIIEIIDSPRLPMKGAKPSPLIGLIIGGMIGLFFSAGFFIIKQYFFKSDE